MKQRINEDNWTGFHNRTVSSGINEAPTDIDAPGGVELLQGTGEAGGYVEPGRSSVEFSIVNNIFSNNHKETVSVSGDEISAAGAADAAQNGVAWFAANMDKIAMVAGGAAILYGLIKLIKAANRSIKVRYNKVVKSLQRAQTQFVTSRTGLDMKSVLPGQGSSIYDRISRWFSFGLHDLGENGKNSEATKNDNIGLIPFCERYKEEIVKDFKCAVEAFNKIKVAADEEKENKGLASEGLQDGSYRSFHEAFASDPLNEGENVNESALAMISAGIGLASLAVRGGQFVISKIKDGKPVEDTEKRVQVTKESVREICYAIVYNYMSKYVNMDRVFKELGISSNSLSDLDKSSCDKLKFILQKYEKPDNNHYTKQYSRIKKAYDTMLKHYYAIGDGIIKNFEKYTEAKDEKHANLLVAGKEKLQGMWDAQKDMFDNNFSHILIEIVSSRPYIAYLHFIVEKVLPVFKSGLAGDADYILDVMPNKNQYYLIRQTQEQPWLDSQESNNGNVAIARILGYDSEKKEISFRLIGLVKGMYDISSNGIATVDFGTDIDYSVYKGDDGKKKEMTLPYSKWLALDPFLMDWKEDVDSFLYKRTSTEDNNVTEYIYAYGSKESNKESGRDEYNRIMFASYDSKKLMFRKVVLIKLANPLDDDEFRKLCEYKSDDVSKNMDFSSMYRDSYTDAIISRINSLKKEDVEVNDTDEIVKIVNEVSVESRIKAASSLYTRDHKDGNNKDITEYLFAQLSTDTESVHLENGAQRLNDTMNEDNATSVVAPGSKGSDKPLVVTVYFAYIYKGKELADDKSENGFTGSIIKIDPACSVDELKNSLDHMIPSFRMVDESKAEKIRNTISEGVKNSIQKKYPIEKISDAIRYIENIGSMAGSLEGKIDEIANKVIAAVAPITKGYVKYDPNPNFKSGIYLPGSLQNNGGCVNVDTGIMDPRGKNIVINVYPSQFENRAPALVIRLGDYQQTVNRNRNESVKNGLVAIIKAYKQGTKLEDPNAEKLRTDKPNGNNASANRNNGNNANASQQNGNNASANGNNANASQQNSVNASVEVKYSASDAVYEGFGSSVTVTRKFSKYLPKWFVLSESAYDMTGFCGKTDLDKPLTRRKMLTRSDVMDYAKSRDNAMVMEFASEQTYRIIDRVGNVPSIATPLYESAMLVRFDDDENVIEKIYLGNNRIQ